MKAMKLMQVIAVISALSSSVAFAEVGKATDTTEVTGKWCPTAGKYIAVKVENSQSGSTNGDNKTSNDNGQAVEAQ